jgi:hypothetical protein
MPEPTYTLESHNSDSKTTLRIEFESEHVSLALHGIESYHQADESTFLLQGRHDEITLNTEKNTLGRLFGPGDAQVHLPDELVSELVGLLEADIRELQ